MPTQPEIAIIGAGPAGLIAAEQLATAGCRVHVYDRMPTPGRKLLIAGHGGLNLTHSEPLEIFLTRYGPAQHWLEPSIRAFPPQALRAWCEGLGEETFIGSSGRVFPRRMKAAPLLRAWMQRLQTLGVTYHPRHRWVGWNHQTLTFATDAGETIHASPAATLLALGGASWPRLGSDAAWVPLLAQAGVEMQPFQPANGGFCVPWSGYFRDRFAGKPLKPVAVSHGDATRQGEAMITSQGLEGGVIYALSASIRSAIMAQGRAVIQLDLRPGMAMDALAQKLRTPRGGKSLSRHLRGAGFSPLTVALLREAIPAEQLATASAEALAGWLKSLPLTLTATAGIARAISSAGGITHTAVDEHFMLRDLPGVFVAGEMLDWEAPTGGYLLQACFSTGIAAAKGMRHYTKTEAK
jgi:uncharacterized flavoprotein (TIGR03862 family)